MTTKYEDRHLELRKADAKGSLDALAALVTFEGTTGPLVDEVIAAARARQECEWCERYVEIDSATTIAMQMSGCSCDDRLMDAIEKLDEEAGRG